MRKTHIAASVALAMITTAPVIHAQESVTTSQQQSQGIEEILVTASRRSASIQDTPVAVSAASGERMQEQQINSVADLISTLPNVQATSSYTSANFYIRGIGNSQTIAGSEAGAAFHVDGAYLSQSMLTMSNFLDVERIEVLRGPQGTLFGRNATGGAINLIANKPTEDFEYGFNTSAGFEPKGIRASGYVSGSLNNSESLLGRFSAQKTYSEGDTENLSPVGPDDLGDKNNYSVRGQLEWRPTSDFSSRISVDYQESDTNGPAAYYIGTPDAASTFPVSTFVGTPFSNVDAGDPEDREISVTAGGVELEALGVGWENIWSLGAGDLKLLTHFNHAEIDLVQDGDGTVVDFTSTTYTDETDEKFVELLFTSDEGSAFRYVVGANYFSEEVEQNVFIPSIAFPFPIDLGGTLESESYAVFVSGNIDVSEDWEIFGGVRYTKDEKSISEYNNFVALGVSNQADDWSEVTYELGASFDISDDLTSYIKYSTGFKSGGFTVSSIASSFEPETNNNFELGLKGVYLDSTLQTNLALFHMNYDELQVNQIEGFTTVVKNAAEAEINGLEAEIIYMPVEQLRIEFMAAWLDATFEDFKALDTARRALGEQDLSGNTLPNAPKSNASLGIYFDQNLNAGTLTYGGRYDWKAKQYFTEFNIPIAAQESVGTLDLSLNFVSSSGQWNAGLYALNVTDESIKSNVLVISEFLDSLTLAQYEPGRQFGVSFGFNY